MTVVCMTKRESWREGYEYAETIADGENGDTVHLTPFGLNKTRLSCKVITGANTGKFQFTTSPDASVIAGTAVWSDWPKGEIIGTDWDVLTAPATGVRGVSVSGEVKIEVVA